jgi:hypothetical protein
MGNLLTDVPDAPAFTDEKFSDFQKKCGSL